MTQMKVRNSKCRLSRCRVELAAWKTFHDPKDGKVKLDGENVVEFPKLPEFQHMNPQYPPGP
jgi:hypothetical protein